MVLLLYAAVILGVIGIDRLTKYLTVANIGAYEEIPIIEGWLHLSHVQNTGAAFGMLKNQRWLFLTVSTVGIAVMIFYLIYLRKKLPLLPGLSLAMIIGGGIGNQIDRIIYGYVTDMIYVKIIDFAVFNVADSFVCIGAVLLAVWVLFFSGEFGKPKKEAEASVTDSAEEETKKSPEDGNGAE